MHLQKTKGESGQEDQPAIQWQLQPENISDRKQQHNDVRDDIKGTGHTEDQNAVSAFALEEVLVVPVVVHVLADQHRRQGRAERVAEDHSHYGSAPSFQGGKDLDVKEKYRHFVKTPGYRPEYLQGERDLMDTLADSRENMERMMYLERDFNLFMTIHVYYFAHVES